MTAAEPVTAHVDAPDEGVSAAEAADMAERRAEIADLTRRVIIGALLTTPVLFAVMAHELFGADWVPGLLLNHWVQLALITPVMFTPAGRSTASAGSLWRTGPRR